MTKIFDSGKLYLIMKWSVVPAKMEFKSEVLTDLALAKVAASLIIKASPIQSQSKKHSSRENNSLYLTVACFSFPAYGWRVGS